MSLTLYNFSPQGRKCLFHTTLRTRAHHTPPSCLQLRKERIIDNTVLFSIHFVQDEHKWDFTNCVFYLLL